MTRDSTLRPLLAVSLAVTVVGSALAYWRHRHASRLVVTVVAAMWVYALIYLVAGQHSGAHADHMADAVVHHGGTSFSGGRLAGIWLGLAALVGAQVWDLADIRLGRRREPRGLSTTHPNW